MKIKKRKRRIGLTQKVKILPASGEVVGYTDSQARLLKAADHSNALQDPFETDYDMGAAAVGGFIPIAPDYDFQLMAGMITISNILRQCIEAMVTNTTAYGYMLEYIGPEGGEDTKEAKAEKQRLTLVLNNPSPEESLREILEKMAWDKETIGFRTVEIIKNDDDEVISFNHVPAISLRKTRQDRTPTTYVQEIFDPETGEVTEKPASRRFRRFVQKVGNDTIYFKEAGDPRLIDMRTGQVTKNKEFAATEIVWDEFYTPGSSYGQPRWMGVLPAILGSRESELVNLNFFRENAIPAMAVLVSGGTLTAETFENLTQYINAVRGKDSMQRIMILEASAEELGSVEHSAPAPRIDMKPMISERQQDGLFKDYDIHNITKVRSAFRLPPILVGKAEDYTRASALASVQTAENQVFMPERKYVDDIINNKILSSYRPRFYRYKSLGPATTDAEELAKVLDALGKEGALTPNVVIKLANKMLGVYIEPVLQVWGDYPFAIIEAMVAAGMKIDGLDGFVKGVYEKAVPKTEPANSNKPSGKVIPLNNARAASKRRKNKARILMPVRRIRMAMKRRV